MAFIGGLLAGCAAASGRVVDGAYVDAAKGFRVDLPRSGWQVTSSPGADLALRHTGADASMAVSASCPEQEKGPLPAVARHVFFGLRHVEWLRQEPIMLDGVAGLETVVRGTVEGTTVQVRSIVVRQKGCLYDLLFVAPPETFEARSADFDRLLTGWEFFSDKP
jgi:predicted Zn-dependent protease